MRKGRRRGRDRLCRADQQGASAVGALETRRAAARRGAGPKRRRWGSPL